MAAKDLLKNRDKKFKLLFEAHPSPMWLFEGSASGKIATANRAACALYGFTPQEFSSKTVTELQAPGEARGEYPTTPAGAAPSIWRHATKSGGIIDVEISVHEIEFEGSKLQLASIVDITARRHLEDQLRQAQKMEAVGMLAGGIAHDFNNLLTIITGYSQLVLNSTAAVDPNRHSVEQVLKAGERAAELTNQLLAFSRRQTPKPKVVDINSLVAGLSAMLRRLIGEDIELNLNLEPGVGRVRVDPGQIEQVLMNLVVNARDAMPGGGAIEVATAEVNIAEMKLGSSKSLRAGPYVLLEVTDTGKGMDSATAARLFEPFFTTKSEGRGTGLGLSTVLAIVSRSGGGIDVHTEPGQGTSVRVFLPRVDLPLAVEPEKPREAASGAETILLVEDEDSVRRLVRETLNRAGYQVLDAADSVEARRLVAAHRGAIDLLITDVVLPRVSGRQLAAELTVRRPSMKILYMSGYANTSGPNSDILQEEAPFLQKPFTPAVLHAKVREVLDDNGRTKRAGS